MRELTPEYLLAALRQAIKTKGLTYRELSEKMGMPLSTFKRHLTSTNLALDKLLEYCRAVDCTLDELQKLANQLQVEDQDYFSHTQDEVFFQYPHLYDFYRELRMLRGKDGYSILMKKYDLSKQSMSDYLGALELLDLVYVDEENNITLHGPLYYSYADNSKLNDKYTEIIKEQTTKQEKCVRVALSRMKITEEQLLVLEEKVAKIVLDFHSKNVVAENFNVSDFTNVLLIAGPHEPVTFSDGIIETQQHFIDDIRYAIASAGDKPSLSI
ncbi:helix-turn-helix transcriptional regulator [Vibrio rotiferianus]|uniref:Helix-turn-helix transcriptional regulator n=1 Tax=Vibrio rotiferianus TaxID=190895 RepID=A0A7Y4E471_9VIBR|nr:helix-turn-helix transcriptional regulator [Vibrio rotiferianus]NOH50724.1 helix-turn-helix transcriptional regulator [Vibrio rotiferianus]